MLLGATAMAVVIAGWSVDRYFLNAKIQEFDYSVGTQSVTTHLAPLRFHGYGSESETFETKVSLEKLSACPTWDGRSDNPPVSARKAIALANDAASELDILTDSIWEFEEIKLSQLGKQDAWCWQVEYRDNKPTIRMCQIWVLLDLVR